MDGLVNLVEDATVLLVLNQEGLLRACANQISRLLAILQFAHIIISVLSLYSALLGI